MHPVDQIIKAFTDLKTWADEHGHGNVDAVLSRIIRDVETLRSLPDEAFGEQPSRTDVESPAELREEERNEEQGEERQ